MYKIKKSYILFFFVIAVLVISGCTNIKQGGDFTCKENSDCILKVIDCQTGEEGAYHIDDKNIDAELENKFSDGKCGGHAKFSRPYYLQYDKIAVCSNNKCIIQTDKEQACQKLCDDAKLNGCTTNQGVYAGNPAEGLKAFDCDTEKHNCCKDVPVQDFYNYVNSG